MNKYLKVAIDAAVKAGDAIQLASTKVEEIEIINKNVSDYVSEVDQQSEKTICGLIAQHFPSHQILGEEYGQSGGDDQDYQWIIDPLDGTTNFLRSIPHFAVSIAMLYQNELEIAVIYDPAKGDLFYAQKGQGAFLNDVKISVSQHQQLQGALLATGIPFNQNTQKNNSEFIATLEQFMSANTSGVRRLGSAALDLAYVACGRYEAYWEANVKPWDIAAGILLVTEAGGVVSDLQGGDDYLHPGNIIAAGENIYNEILAVTRQCYLN